MESKLESNVYKTPRPISKFTTHLPFNIIVMLNITTKFPCIIILRLKINNPLFVYNNTNTSKKEKQLQMFTHDT